MENKKVSRFGVYAGYSSKHYDSYSRSTHYVPGTDPGIKLAADIFRPVTKDGAIENSPLPVTVSFTRYHRAFKAGDLIHSYFDEPMSFMFSYLKELVFHGYIVIIVDIRGSGASTGSHEGMLTKDERADFFTAIEWISGQSWCDGNIGMFGLSYTGMTQILAASTKPKGLKAIFPQMFPFDLYSFIRPNGVYREKMINAWSDFVVNLDTMMPPAPVDGDHSRSLFQKALEDHKNNKTLQYLVEDATYRDSETKGKEKHFYTELNPANYLDDINSSGIAVYLWSGWFDLWPKDAILWYMNLTTPKKLAIGPWSHNPFDPQTATLQQKLLAVEHLRWYDYWLKNIDNSIIDEPPVLLCPQDELRTQDWIPFSEFPFKKNMDTVLHLNAGRSGTIESQYDGTLSKSSINTTATIKATIDYSATTGLETRFYNSIGKNFNYPDLSVNDAKGVTFTSDRLEEDLTVCGIPEIRISTAPVPSDLCFFVYLEEVDQSDCSHYISEGVLKASHCKTSVPPYKYIDIPYYRGNKSDINIEFKNSENIFAIDLYPVFKKFSKGNRIRITIHFIDKDNAEVIKLADDINIELFVGKDKHAMLRLPSSNGF